MKPGSYVGLLWRGSIRRQLVLSFSLASLALMSGFGYLVYEQQREAQYEFSIQRAISVAQALSISGASLASEHDYAGLQRLVLGYAKTLDLRRAVLTDRQGKVLASTRPEDQGSFIQADTVRAPLSGRTGEHVVLADEKLIVIALPVVSEGRTSGWVRVEMTRDRGNANLSALVRTGLIFLLLSVLVVALVAMALATRLTRGLRHLMQVADAVEVGEGIRRAGTDRTDEIGVLARHLDRMLDALDEQRHLMHESEARYRFLADNISDAIWVINFHTSRWEYVSPSVEKLLGYTVEEAFAQSPQDLLTAESLAAIRPLLIERSKLFVSGADGNRIYTDEVEHRRRDGSTVWCEVKTRFARNGRGEAIMLGVTRDITERKQAEQQILNLAFYDPLTQLPNRRLLLDRFGLAISACKRSNRHAALMFIDLDNFKPLNDTHGHSVGDLLLVEVAHRISRCVREVDTVARFGGDEFVVILSELDADRAVSVQQAGAIAEKVRQALAERYRLTVPRKDGLPARIVEYSCTASIGVALFNGHASSQEELLKLADTAMYKAKSFGRNQVHFTDS